MNRVERNQATQPVLLGTGVEGADGDASQVGNPIVAGNGGINTLRRMVPEDVLEARSVVAIAAPQYPTVSSLLFWLETTPESIANMTPDEIIELLLHFKCSGDPTKLLLLLSLSKGKSIAEQVVERIPRDRWLELFGKDKLSADGFWNRVAPGMFLGSLMEETPTEEDLIATILLESGFPPDDLQIPGFDDWDIYWAQRDRRVTDLAQAMMGVYTDGDKRKEFEGKLRDIVGLIFAKLPPPNEENRAYWNNIHAAIANEILDEDVEGKLEELRENFPVLGLIFPRN